MTCKRQFRTESLAMIGEDVDKLDAVHARGVRIAQLTYNLACALGTGCLAPEDRGLTELGRAAIARMELVSGLNGYQRLASGRPSSSSAPAG
jgi:microsomal dipeptidase-like Zn-dependent dipeptidase